MGTPFATGRPPDNPASNAHVGPHSLQVAPDGAVWITLALGNQLARFDPATEQWSTVALAHGYYPHTLRFDARGRIWYTIAGSNHLGMWDPATGTGRELRLPSRTLGQARSVMIEGLSGLLSIHPAHERPRLEISRSQLVWPNGADFDPATLHDWPRFAAALEAQAKNWHLASA